jgi:hypothetical protein
MILDPLFSILVLGALGVLAVDSHKNKSRVVTAENARHNAAKLF